MGRYSRVIFFLVGFLISKISGQAQNGLKADPWSEKEVIQQLLKKAEQYLEIDPDSTLVIAEKAYEISDQHDSDLMYLIKDLLAKGNRKLCKYNNSSEFEKDKLNYLARKDDIIEQVYIYINIGSDLFKVEKFNQAMSYFSKALNISEQILNKEIMAFCKSSIGTIYFMQNKFENALSHHMESLEIYTALNKELEIAATLYSIGSDYSALCFYDKSIEYYLSSLKIYEKKRDRENISMIYHAIGLVYEDIGNLNRALDYNLNAYRLVNENNWELYVSILKWLGTINYKKEDYKKAKDYLYLSLDIESTKNTHIGLAITYAKLGEVYFKLHELEKAHQFYIDALNELRGIDENWVKVKLYNLIGILYVELNKWNDAKIHLLNGLNLSKKLKVRDLTLDLYFALMRFYQRTRDYEKAYFYFNKYHALQDSIHTQSSHRIAEMQLRYETDKREKENQILRRNNSIQQLKIQKQTLIQTIQLLFLMIFMILFGLALFQYRAKNKLNKSLQNHIDETIERHQEQQQIIIHQAGLTSLGELSASIIHDILQPIQNIRLTAESVAFRLKEKQAESDGILNFMNEIQADVVLAEKIVKHIKIFAKKNKQTDQDKFDINDSIRDAILVTRRQFKSQKINVRTRLSDNLPLLNGNHYNFEQIMINLLLNARDAIYQNRAQIPLMPGEIDIHTRISDKEVKMVLSDNGIGIPDHIKVNIFKPFFTTKSAGIGTGLGLVIVYKMIKEIGGKIEYQSSENKGTTVSISIPVKGKKGISERMYLESSKNTYC